MFFTLCSATLIQSLAHSLTIRAKSVHPSIHQCYCIGFSVSCHPFHIFHRIHIVSEYCHSLQFFHMLRKLAFKILQRLQTKRANERKQQFLLFTFYISFNFSAFAISTVRLPLNTAAAAAFLFICHIFPAPPYSFSTASAPTMRERKRREQTEWM